MKKTILSILLLLGLSCVIYAQDLLTNDLNLSLLFPSYNGSSTVNTDEVPGLTQMAYSPNYSDSFGGKLGYGALNIIFGLGSYLAGDWGWGIGLTLWQGLGFAGFLGFGWADIIAGTFFDGYDKRWKAGGMAALGGLTLGPLFFVVSLLGGEIADFETCLWMSVGGAVIGGIVMFCLEPEGVEYHSDSLDMGLAMASFGLWTTGIIFGIILPFLPTPNQSKTAQLDDPRNWTIGVAPVSDRRFAGQIVFTAHF